MRSAVILAGGKSTRMKKDKGMTILSGKPLIQHVIECIEPAVDEIIIVVGSKSQVEPYESVVKGEARVITDVHEIDSPLIGALTGFREAQGEYTLLTGCDMPFINRKVVEHLFHSAEGYDGATYQWPNGWIEPLLAVYHVESSRALAEKQYSKGEMKLRMILYNLGNVNMIPMDQLRELDPDLITFYNANTEEMLTKAEKMLRKLRG